VAIRQTSPALGIAYSDGDLYPWLRKRGRVTEVVIPEREQRLAMAVLGIPGSGKTVTLQRRVWIAAQAGMRVVFVDCKGTDPGLAWQVTCAYRLANPGAIVGFWPAQPLDLWRGDDMARIWRPATRNAGLDGLRIHDLRHTAVALWIAAGANPKEVAARAGHTSVSFTLDRYGHLYPESDAALRDRLDAIYSAGERDQGTAVVELFRERLRLQRGPGTR
jgi:integrase